ncbi:white, partial [Diabrotica virgifera virgifera]
MAVYNRGGR